MGTKVFAYLFKLDKCTSPAFKSDTSDATASANSVVRNILHFEILDFIAPFTRVWARMWARVWTRVWARVWARMWERVWARV